MTFPNSQPQFLNLDQDEAFGMNLLACVSKAVCTVDLAADCHTRTGCMFRANSPSFLLPQKVQLLPALRHRLHRQVLTIADGPRQATSRTRSGYRSAQATLAYSAHGSKNRHRRQRSPFRRRRLHTFCSHPDRLRSCRHRSCVSAWRLHPPTIR